LGLGRLATLTQGSPDMRRDNPGLKDAAPLGPTLPIYNLGIVWADIAKPYPRDCWSKLWQASIAETIEALWQEGMPLDIRGRVVNNLPSSRQWEI